MKNQLTQKRYATILCGEEAVKLTLLPLTYLRLIDVNFALQGKDLAAALSDPTPMDVAQIAYCLLDPASVELIESFQIQINDKALQTNPIHKLYCMMGENTITDGFTNYTSVLQAVSTVVSDSFPQAGSVDKKKAQRQRKSHSIWKRFSTSYPQSMATHIINLFQKSRQGLPNA